MLKFFGGMNKLYIPSIALAIAFLLTVMIAPPGNELISAVPNQKVLAQAQCAPQPSDLISWWRAEDSSLDSAGSNHGIDNQNLVLDGDAESGTIDNWSGLDGVEGGDMYSGNFSFSRAGNSQMISNEFIPIDTSKTYNLSGWFKSAGTAGESLLYFGFIPYDENQERIARGDIDIYPDTETTLLEAIVDTDKIIKVTDGTNWQAYAYAYMAFEVDDSGNYTDLPNRNLSNYGIIRVEDMGTHWEIEFDTSVGKSYPAGTKVREHLSGGSYMYEAFGGGATPAVWTQHSSTTGGENLFGGAPGKWWKKTKYAKIIILANYAQDDTYELLVDDLELYISGVNYSPGKVGQAFSFDGVSTTKITVAHDPSLNPGSGDFSVGAWVNPNDLTTATHVLIDKGYNMPADAPLDHYMLNQYGDSLYLYFTGGGGPEDTTPGFFELNTWVHMMVTYEAVVNTITTYKNGVVDNSFALANPLDINNPEDFVIGSGFNGLIDEVQYFNRALTAAEVLAIHDADSEGVCDLPPQTLAQCSDGLDNDGDDLIDFPDDLGCLAADDNDETDLPPDPCGDGFCDQDTEDNTSCPEDCPHVLPGCGDTFCDPATEDNDSCPEDCHTATPPPSYQDPTILDESIELLQIYKDLPADQQTPKKRLEIMFKYFSSTFPAY